MRVAESISKVRLILIILLSILFANITVYLCSYFIYYFVYDSLTLSGLHNSLIDIIGYGKYQSFSIAISNFSTLFTFLIFILYVYLFYRREKRKLYMNNLTQVIQNIHYIAQGHFNEPIYKKYHNDLDDLVTGVNKIIQQIQEAVAEERHIEQTKTELITNVSHDLRTPLTSMIGYLGLVEQDQYRDEIELRHYTGIAYDKALSLEHLINELFEYTRLQDGRLTLHKTPLNITEMLGELVIQNQLHFDKNNVICREDIPPKQMYVLGEGEKLVRVFDNLMMNAINYGKDGKFIDITAYEENDYIKISVTNYGSPIHKIDIPHLFERFYRTEKSRATHTGGSGLGLAIAKSIITHHDGTIDVQSTFNQTSFIVQLPKTTP